MWKKAIVITGLSAAALGVGGAAWAESASAPAVTPTASVATAASSGTSSSSSAAATGQHKAAGKHHGRRDGIGKVLERTAHAQWTTKDGKTGAFVTHDAIKGSVTAVSATSITVKAADSTSETFAVTTGTKVHVKGEKKGATETVAAVKVGDEVGVLGTGTTSLTATHVLDRGLPKAAK